MNTKALFNISYGVYLVAAKKGDRLNGQIANTVIQVCSEPPRISVAINKNNFTHECIIESKAFSVSILAKDTPLSFIGNFGFKAGRDFDKFENVNYRLSERGVPIVEDNAVAFLEAKLISQLDTGTHTLFIGELVDADVLKSGEPMTYAYYHEVKKGTTPQSAPHYIKTEAKVETKKEEASKMAKYECTVCNYIYNPEEGDPDGGIAPGTAFEDIPDDWVCPICGASKDMFKKV